MVKKLARAHDIVDDYIKSLTAPFQSVKEYGDYIDNYNKIAGDLKNLESLKN